MRITQQNNFCRVFELPKAYPEGYCFGDGRDVTFKMVDWFQPMPTGADFESELAEEAPSTWEKAKPLIVDFVHRKMYVKPDTNYILITDFGKTIIFNQEGEV